MSKVDRFTEELEALCHKYSYSVKGNTTDGSVIVENKDPKACRVLRINEKNAFIKCEA